MLNALYQSLDPVAFSFGPVAVRWYGLAYLAGFLVVGLLIRYVSRRWSLKISDDDVLTIMLGAMIGVIMGARLGYCLFYGNGYYLEHPMEILMVSNGGMSFHGGLFGAVISGIITSRMVGITFLTLADLCAISAPIGLFFGRCANFVNGELWGAPTSLPWGVVFGGAAGPMPRHPSQLYEALLEGLVLFIVLFALSRKIPPRPRGTFLGTFLAAYGIFRSPLEFVRQPDEQLGYLAGNWLTMGQLLSIPLIVIGVVLLMRAIRQRLPQQ